MGICTRGAYYSEKAAQGSAMRRVSGIMFAICSLAGGGALHAANAPLLSVLIAPSAMDEATNKGTVRLTIRVPGIDAPAGTELFKAPPATDLLVTDRDGVVPRAEKQGRGWSPARPVRGELTIGYTLAVEDTATNGGTTPINPRIDGAGFSAIGMTLLAVPEVTTPYRIRIAWDLRAMGAGATAVSSAGDGDAELPAGPVSRLQKTAFMAGKLMRAPASGPSGTFSAAWSGEPDFDLHPPMQWANMLHRYMMTFFGTPHDPAYRVFIRRNGAGNPGGGVAFPNSFFATYGPGVTGASMKQILGHEMTHTFTANGLGNWYVEGDAVFYQVRLPWRAGMVSTEAYLRDINLTAARYYTNAEIGAPEAKILPNFFTNGWLNTLGYDRGALYFAALDGKIRRASGGKRSVDDLVRVLVQKQRSGQEIVEADWVDLVRKDLGEDGVAFHRAMMSGGIVVPESDDYGPCFRRVAARIRRYEMGFTAKPGDGATKVVADLVAGSEAAKAGLRNGDVVVLPIITTEGIKRDPAAMMAVQVTRAGKTFPITYLPRGAAFDAYQWERAPAVPESACRP